MEEWHSRVSRIQGYRYCLTASFLGCSGILEPDGFVCHKE